MDWLIDFFSGYGYIGMFFASFLSGTAFPLSSEVLLVFFLSVGLNAMLLLLFSAVGNVLGGITCYLMGLLASPERIEKWFKITPRKMKKAQLFIDRTGVWSAFFGFVPFLGTAILVVLGVMRANFWKVTIIMALGKIFRYLIVIFSVTGALSWFNS